MYRRYWIPLYTQFTGCRNAGLSPKARETVLQISWWPLQGKIETSIAISSQEVTPLYDRVTFSTFFKKLLQQSWKNPARDFYTKKYDIV